MEDSTIPPQNFPLSNIPLEVQHQVTRYLTIPDIGRLRTVSRQANVVGNNALLHHHPLESAVENLPGDHVVHKIWAAFRSIDKILSSGIFGNDQEDEVAKQLWVICRNSTSSEGEALQESHPRVFGVIKSRYKAMRSLVAIAPPDL